MFAWIHIDPPVAFDRAPPLGAHAWTPLPSLPLGSPGSAPLVASYEARAA